MNSFTKSKLKGSSSPKEKNYQVSAAPLVKSNTVLSNNSTDNDPSTPLGVVEDKEISQHVHPIVHSSTEQAEPPSTPPSIHPAAHRPSSLTTQSSSSDVPGGIS